MKLLYVLLNAAIMVACVHAESCQPGQERFGDSCYQLLTKKMTWEEAAKTCSDMGSGLAVPDSLEENQFIWEKFTRNVPEENVWIGCSDIKEEGKWIQPGEEGYECSYFNWALGEPNEYHPQGDDCIEMWRLKGGFWNDGFCCRNNSAVCERQIVPFATPSMSCLENYNDGRLKSQCLSRHVIKEFLTKGAIACGSACRDEPRCRSFNLRQGSHGEKICQLNNITRSEADEKNIVLDFSCNYFHF